MCLLTLASKKLSNGSGITFEVASETKRKKIVFYAYKKRTNFTPKKDEEVIRTRKKYFAMKLHTQV